jgi:hypothetical protein
MAFPFVLFACASFTTVRQHPEFKVRSTSAKTAMLLPPQVEIIFLSSEATKQLPEEATKANTDLTNLVAAELSHRGFEVKSGQTQRNAIDNTTDNPANAAAVKRMCEQLTDAMYGKQSRMSETQALAYQYTLGPEVTALAKQAGAGSLVFVRLRVWKRSGGDIAAETGKNLFVGLATLGMIVPPNKPSGAVVLQVALVDGATGDVLWGNEVSELSFSLIGTPNYMEKLKEFVTDLFKPYPLL